MPLKFSRNWNVWNVCASGRKDPEFQIQNHQDGDHPGGYCKYAHPADILKIHLKVTSPVPLQKGGLRERHATPTSVNAFDTLVLYRMFMLSRE